MDPVMLVVVVAAVAAAGVWWFLRRRTPPPVEDEWVLPPEQPGRPPFGQAPTAGQAPPEVFDRDMLAHRDRSFDPGQWDNTPDAGASDDDEGAAGEEVEDLPKVFDREYLEKRNRETENPPE